MIILLTDPLSVSMKLFSNSTREGLANCLRDLDYLQRFNYQLKLLRPLEDMLIFEIETTVYVEANNV
jgi:hypothetical protein